MEYKLPSGFNQRMELLLGADYSEFLNAYNCPLQRGLRINTLKCSTEHFLNIFPKHLTSCSFSPFGFILQEDHRAGADPLHHAGAYYMQEPSAMSAVTILDPKPGERILDLCSAPGGKSSQIAAAQHGRGLLWSNEVIRSRAQILAQNLERCGVQNAVISSCDVHIICNTLTDFFDAVLVDAPCSGEGMFRKEPAALAQWSEDNIRHCAKRQQDILNAAANTVAPGGRLVYSTCTFAPEENECQIAHFLLSHPDFELVNTNISFGRSGFSASRISCFYNHEMDINNASKFNSLPLEITRRIFPSDGGEGHFIALLKRHRNHIHRNSNFKSMKPDANNIPLLNLYNSCFTSELEGIPQTVGKIIRLVPKEMPLIKGLGVISAGIAAAKICKNRLEPCHSLFMAANSYKQCISSINLKLNDPRLTAFLRGEIIEAPDCQGWTAVAVENIVTGFGKVSHGILKNHYPKGLRLLK